MIAEFSLLLTCGMSLMWCLMPRDQVTSGFFRIQMLIVLGLTVLAMLTMGQLSSASGESLSRQMSTLARIAAGIGIAFGYVGSIAWRLEIRRIGTASMIGIFVATLTALICSRGGISWLASPDGRFQFLSNMATASVLGGAVTGMLLGHWYLTAPTMSIQPLKMLCWYFALAIVLRFVVSAIAAMTAGHNLHGGVQWTWFALRWLAGILGPMAISVMAIRILRYRNTQAATGVLFAGVILCFIGEMSAALLSTELRVPL